MIKDFNKNKINIVINCSALGDTICGIPIIKALLRENRLNKILCNGKWAELMKLLDIPPEMIFFMNENGLTEFDPNDLIMAPFYLENRAPYRIHLTDFFSYNVSYAVLTGWEKSTKIDDSKLHGRLIDKKYIVLQGSTRLRSRTLLPVEWDKIKNHALQSGLDVIVLGAKEDAIIYDYTGCNSSYIGCDLKTSITLCRDASAVLGVDGGLIYIASLTDVPIVAGYTFVDPLYRAPYRHGMIGWNFRTIAPRGECSYCTNSLCAYGIEFDVKCPREIDFDCMKTLCGDDFITELDRILLYNTPQLKHNF